MSSPGAAAGSGQKACRIALCQPQAGPVGGHNGTLKKVHICIISSQSMSEHVRALRCSEIGSTNRPYK